MEHILTWKAPPSTILRPLSETDYNQDYTGLLGRLTVASHLTREQFTTVYRRIQSNSANHIIIVMEDLATGILLASGTLLIEAKFIHGGSSVGHIEDIVVRKETARKGYGASVVTALLEIAHQRGCYKVILDCADENVVFYEKCGMTQTGKEMSLYFSDKL
jgi:glucosamine-phosphate N-acetyltransferase